MFHPSVSVRIVASNADKFIGQLPRGLNEEVRERGAGLSGGQKQLLTFARAMAFNLRTLVGGSGAGWARQRTL